MPIAWIDANAALTTLLSWVGAAIFSGTVLALATWLVVFLLRRRIRPSVCCALWLIVLVKFVVPIGPAWSVSLTGLASTLGWPTSTTDNIAPAKPSLELIAADMGLTTAAGSKSTSPAEPSPAAFRMSLVQAVAGIYLIGLFTILSYRVRSHSRFVRSCRNLPVASTSHTEQLLATVAAGCRRLGVRRQPLVRISDRDPAPFIVGAWRPTLVLTSRQLHNPEELEAVILHEIAHLRRGDLAVRYLQWFAGTLLYFWPVVAWVNRRIDLARELACDEWALRHSKLAPSQYARCLLEAVQPAGPPRVGFRPQSMASSLNHVERRIDVILHPKSRDSRRAALGVPALLALASWALFVLTGAVTVKEVKESMETPPPPQTVVESGELMIKPVITQTDGESSIVLLLEALATPAEGDDPNVTIRIPNQEYGKLNATYEWLAAKPGANCPNAATGQWLHLAHVTQRLEELAADHPNVDANADGTISRAERDAFLAAKALAAPEAVLEHFPFADDNGDGLLDENEAAALVREPVMPLMIKVETVVALQGETPAAVDSEAEAVGVWVAEDGTNHQVEGEGRVEFHSAQDWLLDNITYEPTVQEVSDLLPLFEQEKTPQALFMESTDEAGQENVFVIDLMHPEAAPEAETFRFTDQSGVIIDLHPKTNQPQN